MPSNCVSCNSACLSSIPLQNLMETRTEISLVVVACNERHNEALNMLKSAIMFNHNRTPLRFIVIAEDELKINFMEKLNDWQQLTDRLFSYEIHSLTFPRANKNEWRKLFKPCAAQRLFLPVSRACISRRCFSCVHNFGYIFSFSLSYCTWMPFYT